MKNHGKAKFFTIIVIVVFAMAFLVFGGIFFRILFSGMEEMKNEMNVNTEEYDTTVTATIIGNRQSQMTIGEGSDAHTSDVYCPIYQYEYNNKSYTASGDVSSSDAHYAVGDVTSIRISSAQPEKMYDPNYNAKSEFDSFMADAGKTMRITTTIGILIAAVVIVVIVFTVRRKMQISQMISEGNVEIVDDRREY